MPKSTILVTMPKMSSTTSFADEEGDPGAEPSALPARERRHCVILLEMVTGFMQGVWLMFRLKIKSERSASLMAALKAEVGLDSPLLALELW